MEERYIFNGGLEQGLLELADEDGLLSEKDRDRLEYLKSLPKNRHEFEQGGKLVYMEIAANQTESK